MTCCFSSTTMMMLAFIAWSRLRLLFLFFSDSRIFFDTRLYIPDILALSLFLPLIIIFSCAYINFCGLFGKRGEILAVGDVLLKRRRPLTGVPFGDFPN